MLLTDRDSIRPQQELERLALKRDPCSGAAETVIHHLGHLALMHAGPRQHGQRGSDETAPRRQQLRAWLEPRLPERER